MRSARKRFTESDHRLLSVRATCTGLSGVSVVNICRHGPGVRSHHSHSGLRFEDTIPALLVCLVSIPGFVLEFDLVPVNDHREKDNALGFGEPRRGPC